MLYQILYTMQTIGNLVEQVNATYKSQANETIVCDMSSSVKYPEGNMEDKYNG